MCSNLVKERNQARKTAEATRSENDIKINKEKRNAAVKGPARRSRDSGRTDAAR